MLSLLNSFPGSRPGTQGLAGSRLPCVDAREAGASVAVCSQAGAWEQGGAR